MGAQARADDSYVTSSGNLLLQCGQKRLFVGVLSWSSNAMIDTQINAEAALVPLFVFA
jgi:hypothetical protein